MRKAIDSIKRSFNWHDMDYITDWIIDQAIAIQQIPAPTFHEAARSRYVADQFRALGLEAVSADELNNVYGVLPGQDRSRPGIMISAHTDTVFSIDNDLKISRHEDLIYGPGLGDNSLGVAGMLGLAMALKRQNITPGIDLWFAATTCEEGLGDLGGMKEAFARLQSSICAVINLEGLAFGHIYHSGIAVRRLHITAAASGGHSWLHFGRASAIHGLVNLGAHITSLKPPENPRTTYNIGMIDGGQTINSIATSASLWLDMRSEDRATLETLEQQVREYTAAAAHDDLRFTIEVVGDRPAGTISTEHPLVQGALAALEHVGIRGSLETGSTDANVPLAQGCPAVTIGITRGGNAHRLDEYIETPPIASGIQQLILLALGASHYYARV